ncbi:HAMP domain-containing histidine kinase [Sphingobacterium sp. SGG-5]|uniref:sensor histidine kinase n=1 Tax=Sphingobacterium sp. SGG-5 TaxID=2710881 RepID=UPI0013E9B287|nr:HAMP domain-containing sensor histidine kinase [Sphingobacterium sp. SGG-5]NGM62490.1 HAMP domain-containing histidine kinase [Sphingobacterium sp. SGG-5]
MKKRSITLIIWLMSIALLGVMAMQYYFIRETYRQKSILFDEAVNASLSKVASIIEKNEVLNLARTQRKINQEKYEAEQRKQAALAEQLKIQDRIQLLRTQQYEYYQNFKNTEDELKATFPNLIYIENWFYETYIRRPQYKRFLDINVIQEPIQGTTLYREYVDVSATQTLPVIAAKDDSVRYIVADIDPFLKKASRYTVATLQPQANAKIAFELRDLEERLEKLNNEFLANNADNIFDTLAVIGGKKPTLIEDVALGLTLANRPLRERININLIHTLLEEELQSRDIRAPFNIEVRDSHKLIYHTTNVASLSNQEQPTRYTTALFKGDVSTPTGRLSIYFPDKKGVIFDNMSYLILPTLALFALLVGSFAYTLTIVFRQKKISEMKTDFINNMTHEFKTPVATIMIASESLRDPEIASNENRVNKLANIIYDENVRLGSHIERVLNIARLEKENLKIERVDVQINPLVEGVLDSMQLQLQKASGILHADLRAQYDLVIGDELHLSNVFFNLVDNAIKYSPNSPEITVTTFNHKGNIIISVADKGLGMTKDQQEKIFDQFYRIPTGNVHNVKGFGLGLSYVNDIVKRLDGTIQVKSEKDKGTVFEITLPLKKQN